jgi:hypothetical protein
MCFAMGVITVGKNSGYAPILNDFVAGNSTVLPVEKWWKQTIWSTSPQTKLTRESLVLAAANQDGGAHVDQNLDEKYEEYSTMSHGKIIEKGKGFRKEISITDMHLVALRTMGNEVLKSRDLQALLKNEC